MEHERRQIESKEGGKCKRRVDRKGIYTYIYIYIYYIHKYIYIERQRMEHGKLIQQTRKVHRMTYGRRSKDQRHKKGKYGGYNGEER
jgi:hypothetical protein